MPASVNFEISPVKAGIIRLRAATAGQADPGYSTARDRSRLQQTQVTFAPKRRMRCLEAPVTTVSLVQLAANSLTW
jgi:hypothetical protein